MVPSISPLLIVSIHTLCDKIGTRRTLILKYVCSKTSKSKGFSSLFVMTMEVFRAYRSRVTL